MKKYFWIAAFVFIFFNSVSAQKKMEKELLGSWELIKTDSNGILSADLDKEIYSFYKKGECQINETNIFKDSTGKMINSKFVYNGKWEIKSGKISINKCHDYGLICTDQNYKIISVTDSSLIMSYDDGEYVSHLKKVNSIPEMSQGKWNHGIPDLDDNFLLVNSLDSTKKIVIKNDDYISVEIDEPSSGTSVKSKKSWTDGQINDLKDSTLILFTDQYKTETKFKNDSSNTFEKNYDHSFIQNINLHFVNEITYSSNKRSVFNGLMGGMIFFSGLDLFVLAPIASLKFNNEHLGFNSKRYFTWAGIGLIGLGISIPLNLCTYEKTYFITLKNYKREKKYWYLEKE